MKYLNKKLEIKEVGNLPWYLNRKKKGISAIPKEFDGGGGDDDDDYERHFGIFPINRGQRNGIISLIKIKAKLKWAFIR